MPRKRSVKKDTEAKDFFSSTLFRILTRTGLAAIIILVFLTLIQCSIEKPEAPQWNTQLTVPVVNRTYMMDELVEKIDQDGIAIDSDSNVVFSIDEDIDTFTISGDQLSTADVAVSLFQQLGPVDLNPPAVDPMSLSYIDIVGLAAGTVPPTSFSETQILQPSTDFTSLTIANGYVQVPVQNNLGLNLDTVIIELYDYGSSVLLGDTEFVGGIDNGQSKTALFDLDGQTVSNTFEVRLSCHTPGGTILSADDKSLSADIDFSDPLTVSAAQAVVPVLSRQFSEIVTLSETEPIHAAVLENGDLSLTVYNNTAVDASVDLAFPDIFQSGQPLTITRSVPALGSDNVVVSLDNAELRPADLSIPQDLTTDVTATLLGSGSQVVDIDQTNSFSVDAGLSNLSFASVTGIFDSTPATLQPTSENIDVPQGFEYVELQQAILTLEIENHFNLAGDISITVDGDNGKSITINGQITAAPPGLQATTLLLDSTVADFLSPVPTRIDISGSASFGDGATVATINDGDFVFARVHVVAPLEVIISQDTEVEADIQGEDIDQDDIDIITDHVAEARFVYTITNHLPLGVNVAIHLGGDSTTVMASPETLIDGLTVPAAPTIAGIVSDTISTGVQSIILTNADIQVLNNDTLFIGQQIILQGTGGQPVRLTKDDYVSVSGYLEIEYLFDGEL